MAANRGCSNSYFTDLVVKEVEQVFDGQRQRGAAMRRAEDRLEEVVDELLERALRGQEPRQVDLRDHLVVPLAVLVVVPLVSHQVPDLEAVVVVVVERRGSATQRRAVTSAAHLRQVERLVFVVQVSVGLV